MERDSKERLKVHRRSARLAGLDHTILSPRPSETVRFATNLFHDTWHVISDREGAHLLARLSWAMAFQKRERTVLVIDANLLVPNPFDGDPSSPIVIVNNDLGPFGREAVSDLRAKLPWQSPSLGTVVLQTRGLDLALADTKGFNDRDDQAVWRDEHQKRRWIDGSGGLWIFAAPSPVLRRWGVDLAGLGEWSPDGEDWSYLDYPDKTGEVQVFNEFETKVSSVLETRARMFPGKADICLTDLERPLIWEALQRPLS
jgi:hypothetical protein